MKITDPNAGLLGKTVFCIMNEFVLEDIRYIPVLITTQVQSCIFKKYLLIQGSDPDQNPRCCKMSYHDMIENNTIPDPLDNLPVTSSTLCTYYPDSLPDFSG